MLNHLIGSKFIKFKCLQMQSAPGGYVPGIELTTAPNGMVPAHPLQGYLTHKKQLPPRTLR